VNQVVASAHPHQGIVIAGAVALEKVGQIKRWFGQQAVADHVQWNQQASDATVAVQEGMDGFKLVVADGRAHQVRHSDRLVVPELFKVAHQFGHIFMVRRNKGGIGQAGAADPVLADTEFPRLLVFAAHSAHQNGVGLLEQAVRERQCHKLGNGCVDRIDVVAHLAPVITLFRLDLLFGHQGLVDAGLGAFNAAGGLGFLDYMHLDE